MEATILAGIRDGYWQGKSQDEMAAVIGRYLLRPKYVWKEASHLWILTPQNVQEMLESSLGQTYRSAAH